MEVGDLYSSWVGGGGCLDSLRGRRREARTKK